MKLTDALRGEHAVLYDVFAYLDETMRNTDDMQDIRGAVSVVERLLLSHARIEEDLLFPRLEPHLGEMGPLAVMRAEHGRIDGLLDAARQEDDVAALKSLIGELLTLAYGHFQKEESVLFDMAERFLGAATLTELGGQWAAARNVIVKGQGCMATH
ncbi:MAG: hemerythrin domain-containing protein [Alphaproteobacteria bacterium]|nr:hemerythrin domain-containing protein [Alphaproteobacteria bacterium]